MGWQAMKAAYTYNRGRKDMSLAEASLLVTLAYHVNDSTGECFPSQALLRAETRQNPRTLRAALKKLEAAGAVAVETKCGRRSNYRLLIPAENPLQKCTGCRNAPGQKSKPGGKEEKGMPKEELVLSAKQAEMWTDRLCRDDPAAGYSVSGLVSFLYRERLAPEGRFAGRDSGARVRAYLLQGFRNPKFAGILLPFLRQVGFILTLHPEGIDP